MVLKWMARPPRKIEPVEGDYWVFSTKGLVLSHVCTPRDRIGRGNRSEASEYTAAPPA